MDCITRAVPALGIRLNQRLICERKCMPYAALAEECAIEKDIEIAFVEIASFYSLIVNNGSR